MDAEPDKIQATGGAGSELYHQEQGWMQIVLGEPGTMMNPHGMD